MISKKQISLIRSLWQKKYRNETGLFIVEGTKIVNELFNNGSWTIHSVYATPISKEIPDFNIVSVTEEELKKISQLSTPNEMLAIVHIPEWEMDEKELFNSLTLVLDDIRDPGNLGTIIRIADWFGIKNIICSPESVDVFNFKVVQATMGSLFRVKVHYRDLKELFEQNKADWKLKVYGAVMEGENIYKTDLDSKGFILLGSEASGISETAAQYVTANISIPRGNTQQQPESLNIAIAAGIICAEFRRRN